jgi:hypothetical protein
VRRALLWALVLLVLVAGAGALWVRFFAGGPVGPFPGGSLAGEPAPLPEDWGFANQWQYVQVESRAGALPYSTGCWFMAYEGRIHILMNTFFGEGLKHRIDRDPHVRIRLDGKLYDQVATQVSDPEVRAALLAPLIRRLFAIEIGGAVREAPRPEGDVPVEMWVYRLEDPA